MRDKHLAFIYSEDLERFAYPQACPFNTRRAGMVREAVAGMGLLTGQGRSLVPPAAATREELERVHTPEYLDAILRAEHGTLDVAALNMGLGTPDCPVFEGMYEYAALAAGATATGARLLLSGDAGIAFNPSGGFHHAHRNRAAGFCYINDIVLALWTLLDAGQKPLFLDIDVHHCDGVQEVFESHRDVMTVSLHESGETLFPGTGQVTEIGTGEGRGYTVNIPLPVGVYDAIYEKAFRQAALPLIEAFAPSVIVMEVGMDTLSGDPLAHLHLTNNVVADIVAWVRDMGTPLLVTGGGGYNVDNTVRGWALVWSVLCGVQSQHDDMSLGMGGVMLETMDWSGGLRDRALLSDAGRRGTVDRQVNDVIRAVRETVFPLHNLSPDP